MDLLEEINSCNTMPELDNMRLKIIKETKDDVDLFRETQKAFVKRKNKLKRIPLSERSW